MYDGTQMYFSASYLQLQGYLHSVRQSKEQLSKLHTIVYCYYSHSRNFIKRPFKCG